MNTLSLTLRVCAILWVLLEAANAQIAVYQGGFDRVGSTVNFSYYERAFLVADLEAGSGSFLFLDVLSNGKSGPKRVYAEVTDAANLFVAVRRDGKGETTRKLVLRAISDNGTAQSYYLGVGELKTSIEGRQSQLPVEVRAPKTIKGHVLTSDDESDLSLSATSGLGSAGAAEFSLSLDSDRTKSANRKNQTATEVLTEIKERLELMGFSNEVEESTSTSTDSTDTTTDTSTSSTSTSSDG